MAEGHGLGLAGDVGDEGDRRPELADRLGEGEDRARDDAGQDQRQRDGHKHPEARGPERAGRGLELRVHRLDGQPDRAHHQRKGHDRRRHGGPGPAKGQHDAEPLVQKLPHRPRRPKVSSSR
jgi:hypothetical protein